MKMNSPPSGLPKRGRFSLSLCLRLLLVLALVLSLVTIPLSGVLNRHLSRLASSPSLAEDQASTASLSRQVAAEGAILLENQNETLPLSPARAGTVALFGLAALHPVYADGRSDQGSLADALTASGFSLNQTLLDFYRDQTAAPAPSRYDTEPLAQVRKESDIAVIALSHTVEQDIQPTDDERALLQMVAELDFDRVIVLINSAKLLQLDVTSYGMDAALWIGAPGAQGLEAVGDLLSGQCNPSGRTTVTYAYDWTSAPAADTDRGNTYTEGIYVGYRYYETRYADNETAYAGAVQYPFGYGLSYTTFQQEITDFAFDGTTVSAQVTVTNTGAVDGATVVQLYAHPPYAKGDLETASTVLVGYTRTDTLAPGEEATVEIQFPLSYMASYDAEAGHFVLKKGNYQIQLQSDAHTPLDTRTLHLTQAFTYADTVADFSEAEVPTVLSRSNWKTLQPDEAAEPQAADTGDGSAPVSGDSQEKVTLRQLQEAAYDDPAWSTLLDRLSQQQLTSLTTFDGLTLPGIHSIGLSTLRFLDGCYGLTGTAHGVHYHGTLLPCMSLIGSTWDNALVEALGAALGQEAQDFGLSGVYGLSGTLLRTPEVGDACSEDPVLTGSLLSAYGAGVESTGTLCVIQDYGIPVTGEDTVLLDEQALRELYLRPFALCLQSGSVSGVSTSEGTLGKEAVGASSALLRDVLRTEWKFTGLAISSSDPIQALDAGTSLVISEGADEDISEAVARESAHDTLYTIAQHHPEGSQYGPKSTWRTVLICVDVVLLCLNTVLFWRHKRTSL